ncbi:hypothetical protein D3C71_1008850 [compost metagenome]
MPESMRTKFPSQFLIGDELGKTFGNGIHTKGIYKYTALPYHLWKRRGHGGQDRSSKRHCLGCRQTEAFQERRRGQALRVTVQRRQGLIVNVIQDKHLARNPQGCNVTSGRILPPARASHQYQKYFSVALLDHLLESLQQSCQIFPWLETTHKEYIGHFNPKGH